MVIAATAACSLEFSLFDGSVQTAATDAVVVRFLACSVCMNMTVSATAKPHIVLAFNTNYSK
jgi:hypothetical protein